MAARGRSAARTCPSGARSCLRGIRRWAGRWPDCCIRCCWPGPKPAGPRGRSRKSGVGRRRHLCMRAPRCRPPGCAIILQIPRRSARRPRCGCLVSTSPRQKLRNWLPILQPTQKRRRWGCRSSDRHARPTLQCSQDRGRFRHGRNTAAAGPLANAMKILTDQKTFCARCHLIGEQPGSGGGFVATAPNFGGSGPSNPAGIYPPLAGQSQVDTPIYDDAGHFSARLPAVGEGRRARWQRRPTRCRR